MLEPPSGAVVVGESLVPKTQEIPHISTPPSESTLAPLDRATWQQLWKPYWLAKRKIPGWLPLAPSMDAL